MLKAMLMGLVLAAAVLPVPAAAGGCGQGLEPWTEIDLYFGRNIGRSGEVSEADFRSFLAHTVTPRFPDGLTVVDALGQFRDGNRVVRERSKLLILLVPDARAVAGKVAAVVDRYKERFRQQSVLRTQQEVCLSFD